ncbi:hypothetical protein PRIEUP_LOCUS122, partial [Pristimantis euphronides]
MTLNRVKNSTEEFRKAYSEQDLQFPEWLSWLNPLNWFKGLGGWFSGLVHIVVQGVFLIFLLFIVIKLVIVIIQRLLGAKCNCFSGKRKQPPQIEGTRIMTTTLNIETHCKLCGKPLNPDFKIVLLV